MRIAGGPSFEQHLNKHNVILTDEWDVIYREQGINATEGGLKHSTKFEWIEI